MDNPNPGITADSTILRSIPLALAVLAASCGGDPPGTATTTVPERTDVPRAVAGIDESDLLGRVAVMAHDSMLGRATPSPELEEVARWIADDFRSMGLEPGGDGETYLHWYTVPDSSGARAPNVVGILPGSDDELRNEYVVYSAHMDHVGVRAPDANGDSIFNGADDDASGTAAMMEIAQAMASLEVPPRRSTIFLAVSGEERGLWGSRAFVTRSPVPVGAMVANFNLDMVGRNWPDTIVAIGREHSSLGRTLGEVNARHPELGMTAIDDIWPDERFYFRSDHYNFARNGVPVLFFFNGTHEDYHRPSDEVDRIDADKAARIARLLFYLGLEVGDAAAPPEWDPESYDRIVIGGGDR